GATGDVVGDGTVRRAAGGAKVGPRAPADRELAAAPHHVEVPRAPDEAKIRRPDDHVGDLAHEATDGDRRALAELPTDARLHVPADSLGSEIGVEPDTDAFA